MSILIFEMRGLTCEFRFNYTAASFHVTSH